MHELHSAGTLGELRTALSFLGFSGERGDDRSCGPESRSWYIAAEAAAEARCSMR